MRALAGGRDGHGYTLFPFALLSCHSPLLTIIPSTPHTLLYLSSLLVIPSTLFSNCCPLGTLFYLSSPLNTYSLSPERAYTPPIFVCHPLSSPSQSPCYSNSSAFHFLIQTRLSQTSFSTLQSFSLTLSILSSCPDSLLSSHLPIPHPFIQTISLTNLLPHSCIAPLNTSLIRFPRLFLL
ncbi:hypothetical protein BJX76DRAFT_180622 [Aspergillus varians]